MSKSKTPSLLKILFIQLCLILVILVVAELIFALLFPVVPDRSVNKQFSQNIEGLKKEIIYDRNRVGLRTNSLVTLEKPDDTVRILCVGASTTDQATQSTADTWCANLQEQLTTEYQNRQIRFESAAYGRGGIRAVDNAVWLSENLDAIEPDIVVTLLGINDLSLNGGENYQTRKIQEVLDKKSKSAAELCQEYLQLCRRGVSMARNIIQMYKLRSGTVVEWHSENLPARRSFYKSLALEETPVRQPDPIEEFSDAINWIYETLSSNQIEFVALGQPVLWNNDMTQHELDVLWFPVATPSGPVRASPGWLETEMKRYSLVQKSATNNFGGIFVDLDSMFPKDLNMFFDDCHFTDAGSEYLAELIFPAVKDRVEKLLTVRDSK
ncbi:MAG: SGNH/GDSL hydrolase family protein [Acidiferrobacterales bacterium]|nr:SGNH/GDSL hydrolase family protein [Acidiferrobacterales bacterium]